MHILKLPSGQYLNLDEVARFSPDPTAGVVRLYTGGMMTELAVLRDADARALAERLDKIAAMDTLDTLRFELPALPPHLSLEFPDDGR